MDTIILFASFVYKLRGANGPAFQRTFTRIISMVIFLIIISIGYTPRARLLSDLATECRRQEVAKSLGNQARGVQPACTMTIQNSKIRLISSIALKSRFITYLST